MVPDTIWTQCWLKADGMRTLVWTRVQIHYEDSGPLEILKWNVQRAYGQGCGRSMRVSRPQDVLHLKWLESMQTRMWTLIRTQCDRFKLMPGSSCGRPEYGFYLETTSSDIILNLTVGAQFLLFFHPYIYQILHNSIEYLPTLITGDFEWFLENNTLVCEVIDWEIVRFSLLGKSITIVALWALNWVNLSNSWLN